MFGKLKNANQQVSKLPGPRDIPELVKKSPEFLQNVDAGTTPFLKAVVKRSEKAEKVYDIRIFDPADAEAQHKVVKDYKTLTMNEAMIIAEGWFDEASKKTELIIKRPIPKPNLLAYDEILVRIEGLTEPGSSIFFYMAAGPGIGGPLGRGGSIIRLNAVAERKRQRKYSIYATNIVNLEPAGTEMKIFDSDKAGYIAKWISASQEPRFC